MTITEIARRVPDTRTLYLMYRRRRAIINHAKDCAAFAFAMAVIWLAWMLFA